MNTIETTRTALGTNIARVRGANIDRINDTTRRAVWGSWTPESASGEWTDWNAGDKGHSGADEDLLDLVPADTKPYVRMATPGQQRYMASLATERGVDLDVTKVEFGDVDATLARLKATPRPAAPGKGLEDGVYVKGEDVFMVKHAIHGSGQQYASKLTAAPKLGEAGKWVYMGKAPLATLTPADRLTRDLAQKFGEVYGCCVRCGRALTKPESIARSVGTKCWGEF